MAIEIVEKKYGNVTYYGYHNVNGYLVPHNINGVIWNNGRKEWKRYGMIKKTFADGAVIYGYYDLHRDFIPHRKEKNGPAIIHADGTEEWFNNGKRHREDDPAVIHPNGAEEWYNNGKMHREDGPAIIYPNGNEQWWINGKPVTHKLEKWLKKRNIDQNNMTEEDKLALYKDIGIKIMDNKIKVFLCTY